MMSEQQKLTGLMLAERIVALVMYYGFTVAAFVFVLPKAVVFSLDWLWFVGVPFVGIIAAVYVATHLRLFRGRRFTWHSVGVWLAGLAATAGLLLRPGNSGIEFDVVLYLITPMTVFVVSGASLLWIATAVQSPPDAIEPKAEAVNALALQNSVWVALQYVVFAMIFGGLAFVLVYHGSGQSDGVIGIVGQWLAGHLGLWVVVVMLGYVGWHLVAFRHQRFTFHSLGHLGAFLLICQMAFGL